MAALFGRRLRRGATTTAVAALAVAALSASQAPAIVPGGGENGKQASGSSVPDESPDSASGDSSYHTDLPPLNTPDKPGTSIDLPDLEGAAEAGIPATVLSAYKQAEQRLGVTNPGCNLPWQLLAAIGKVESGQARGGRVDDNGTTFTPILGPVLNGVGFANISDTDNGAYDGDKTHDRAVGPMQFIPSTWATWGQDANGDGRKDPNNIFDAALAAGRYLCANNRDLSLKSNLDQAILSYNRSREYLATVLSWLEYYKRGSHEVPDGTGVLPEGPGPLNPGGPSNSPSPGPTTSPSPDESPTTNPPKPPKPPATKPPTTPPTKPPTTPPTTPPTPAPVVEHLEDAGTGKLSATAGTEFAGRVTVRGEDGKGKAVGKAAVRFTIVGDTDATFAGGSKNATGVSGATGVAKAPALRAGEKTGDFTVRADVVGRTVPAVDFTATVTERQADAVARTSDKEMTAAPGGEFADSIQVKATNNGVIAPGVAVKATMIKSADDASAADKGPYFKDAAGKPLRALTDLKTDAQGLLVLPKIFADDATGTFLLRVETAGGAKVTIELKVTAPEA
ncbi:lytic transglycosylase domain-containing protein [Streptomyces niveus]|uniref:lytic transglycosylase domain-containing protein n=1 Tax=Streptomyces niveus TaxID=193462 RepID=UPI002E2F2A94|nr:lytic transglycosylase domain-containing protein [Streptomyces niveus]WTA58270.1 lytic transglycosylase domain-containing protein [Streptomyces niveus]